MSGASLDHINFVPLEEFTQYLLPSVHNADVDIAMHYIRVAAIEFAMQTRCITDMVPIDVQSNVGDYVIPCLNTEVQVFGVKAVSHLGRPLYRLKGNPVQDRTILNPGYWFVAPSELHIRPMWRRDIPHGLLVEVELAPAQDASSLPAKLYHTYAEMLAFGAMNRLLSMKESDWFDPIEANKQWKKFRDAKNTVKIRVEKGDSSEPQMARGVRWA